MKESSQTILSWATASEVDNDYFTVERSGDGTHFSPVVLVNGAGNSENQKDYTAYDENPLPGVSYYRLKQTDFNNASKTYNMVEVGNKQASYPGINIATASISGASPGISYILAADGDVLMRVTDMNGKTLINRKIASRIGMNNYSFDNTSTWKPGMYIVGLFTRDNAVYTKMVKL